FTFYLLLYCVIFHTLCVTFLLIHFFLLFFSFIFSSFLYFLFYFFFFFCFFVCFFFFFFFFFFSSRRRHTRLQGDWSSDVCSSDLRHDRQGEIIAGTAGVVRFKPGTVAGEYRTVGQVTEPTGNRQIRDV